MLQVVLLVFVKRRTAKSKALEGVFRDFAQPNPGFVGRSRFLLFEVNSRQPDPRRPEWQSASGCPSTPLGKDFLRIPSPLRHMHPAVFGPSSCPTNHPRARTPPLR